MPALLVGVLVLGAGATPATAAAGAQRGPASQVASPGPAGTLPSGWSLQARGEGLTLTWRSPRLLPVGGARVDILLDGRRAGLALVSRDRRSVSVDLPAGTTASDVIAPQVVAAGRRLDVAPAVRPPGRAAAVPPPAAAAPLLATDPGKPGPYRTSSGEYTLKDLKITGFRKAVEVRGVVVAPRAAPGRRPLVLLLHGRHASCYRGGPGGEATLEWPCPAGWTPIPSHRGYLQTQQLLASQGYVTVSISANGVNGQDFAADDGGALARSVLVRHHLARWASWTAAGRAQAPKVVRSAPKVDLRRVLLVGHSRGGEGVNRAALDSAFPAKGARPAWTIAGLLHLAPTAFGQNPVPGVPTAVVLPYCDGDVFDLQGQQYVDRARDTTSDPVLRSSVLVLGANHNYFNSEWTPGVAAAPADDDWFDGDDPVCGNGARSTRLTAAQQRAVGATYVAAAARAFVQRDAKVLPLLDGSEVRAASAGPATVLTHALGGRRVPVANPGTTGATKAPAVTASGSVKAVLCRGIDPERFSRTCPAAIRPTGVHPHFLPMSPIPGEPGPRALSVSWTRASGAATIASGTARDLRGSGSVALRVVVAPGSAGTRFAVRVTDAAGSSKTLGTVDVDGLPASPGVGTFWAQEVRVPLAGARGVNLRKITRLSLLPKSSSGRLLLLDAWGRAAGASTRPVPALPRLDVRSVRVREGHSGTRTVTVPIEVSRPSGAATPRAVWVATVNTLGKDFTASGRIVALKPGQRRVSVPVKVRGDRRDDADGQVFVLLKAVRGVSVGTYAGQLTVLDDDPAPRVTATPVATSVHEGSSLRWRFTLSAVSDQDTVLAFEPVAPAPPAVELFSDDVPAAWLADELGEVPDAPVAFSTLELTLFATIPAGMRTVELSIPTLTDDRSEGTEVLSLSVPRWAAQPGLPAGAVLSGSVSDPQ